MKAGRIVETYKHPRLGYEVLIRLDVRRGRFNAEYNNQFFEHTEISAVRHWAIEAMESGANLNWVPVLTVSFRDRWHGDGTQIQFDYDRCWMAQKVSGEWLRADWETEVYEGKRERKPGDPADRVTGSRVFTINEYVHGKATSVKFSIPFKDTFSSGSKEHPYLYLPYTEALWSALEKIEESLRQLQKRIIEHLGDDTKRALLTQNVQRAMLPAAKEETATTKKRSK